MTSDPSVVRTIGSGRVHVPILIGLAVAVVGWIGLAHVVALTLSAPQVAGTDPLVGIGSLVGVLFLAGCLVVGYGIAAPLCDLLLPLARRGRSASIAMIAAVALPTMVLVLWGASSIGIHAIRSLISP